MPRAPLGRPSRTFAAAAILILLPAALLFPSASNAQSQSAPPPSQTSAASSSPAPQEAAKPAANSSNEEIVSTDVPTTFKVNVNLVLVRVVVRDANGKVVPNLKKEDFQLTDNRKVQIISSFSTETPASHVPTVKMNSENPGPEGTPVKAPTLPSRFVTLFFDDLHLSTRDAMLSRQAATKLFAAMGPNDRLSIFTTSGQVEQDYTSDRDKLNDALLRIAPHPLASSSATDCPPMTFYEAYQIIDANDPTALQVATADVQACTGSQMGAALLAKAAAQRELSMGESSIQFAFANLDSLIRRMSALPGQRVIVLMSPGFFVTPAMHQTGDVIDRATKANVVINTIDARGLYVPEIFDASKQTPLDPTGLRIQFLTLEESAQDDVLAEFADGTGGLFFHNRNDIDQGLLQAAAEPEVSYVLGFAPQNLKLDGNYHHLKVTLVNKQKWSLQARHGYFAPKGQANPEALAKEEIEFAVFSQEEMHELPIDCRTQFFKSNNGAHLSVLTRLDTKALKFRKAGDRNDENLIIVTAIFDDNGNLISGQQKTIDLKLKDATLDRVNRAGLSFRSAFDLQPGSFLVRVVVRDSEGDQMAALNRGVVIP